MIFGSKLGTSLYAPGDTADDILLPFPDWLNTIRAIFDSAPLYVPVDTFFCIRAHVLYFESAIAYT
jgi:hypothetical protein